MNLHENINRIKEMMGVSSIDESETSHYRIFYDDNEIQRYAKVLNRAMNEYDWWKGIDIDLLSYDERSNIINMSATLNVDEEWATKQWRFFNDEKPFQDYSIALSEIIDSNFANKLRDEFNNVFEFTFGLPSIVRSFNNIELNLIPTETIQEQQKPRKDLSDLIKQSLEPIMERENDIICDIEITAPWYRESYSTDYKVDILIKGGPGSKYWPVTQAVRSKFNKITDEVWQTIYGYLGEAVDVYIEITHQCNKDKKEEESEGVGAYAAPAFEMKPDHVHFKHLYNENEEKQSKVDALKELVKNVGFNTAAKMVGGTENLVNILFGGDIMNYYKETGFAPVRISADGMNMYIDDLIISTLGLEPKSGLMKDEVGLGDFKWKSGGINYKFTANIRSFESQNNGQKLWRVVGTCGDSGFGYAYIPQRRVIGKRGRQQIFKQIIDKYGLQRFL